MDNKTRLVITGSKDEMKRVATKLKDFVGHGKLESVEIMNVDGDYSSGALTESTTEERRQGILDFVKMLEDSGVEVVVEDLKPPERVVLKDPLFDGLKPRFKKQPAEVITNREVREGSYDEDSCLQPGQRVAIGDYEIVAVFPRNSENRIIHNVLKDGLNACPGRIYFTNYASAERAVAALTLVEGLPDASTKFHAALRLVNTPRG